MRIFRSVRIELWIASGWVVFSSIILSYIVINSLLYPKLTSIISGLTFAVLFFMPSVCILCKCFIKRLKTTFIRYLLNIIITVIGGGAFLVCVTIFVMSYSGGGRFSAAWLPIFSFTDKLKNYLVIDENVKEWSEDCIGIFPQSLPKDTGDFCYQYTYIPGLFPNCIVKTVWTPDVDTFNKETERIDGFPDLNIFQSEHGYMYYNSNYSIEDLAPKISSSPACYVDFNADTKTITYAMIYN